MHIHHLIRGGLLLTGVGIGSALITAAAQAGSHDVVTAPAVERVVATAPVPSLVVGAASLPEAPAAVPVLIESVEVEAAAAVPPAVLEEAEPVSEPAPERPVVHAGPGPATPVPGATTLIDPMVIERDVDDAQA